VFAMGLYEKEGRCTVPHSTAAQFCALSDEVEEKGYSITSSTLAFSDLIKVVLSVSLEPGQKGTMYILMWNDAPFRKDN
jgi:hypothetical protein